MSGHSKGALLSIKGALDAKRGKIFTKLIREITVAARDGGGDPDTNPIKACLIKCKECKHAERHIRKGL